MPENDSKISSSDWVRRYAWPILSGFVFLILAVGVLRIYEDGMRTRERGRLVSSIVDQQYGQLATGYRNAPLTIEDLASDAADLRRWLVEASFEPGETPGDLAVKVETILQNHHGQAAVSSDMRESLDRWVSSLVRWNAERHALSGQQLLEEARQHYFEASGYQKIGKSYDATVLQLWTISLLTQYVDRNPFSPNVPEALFMMGMAYMHLGSSLPSDMRRDRILTLCGELYPDSLWATRSDTIWKEALSDEI